MTIAACYVCDEGVVLGADSTTTYLVGSGTTRHMNNSQKVFEIGEMGSTLGLVTWGRGELPQLSYRHMAAELSDDLLANHPSNVRDVADRFSHRFWAEYSSRLAADIAVFQALKAKPARTPDEEKELGGRYRELFVGFCVGGRVCAARRPTAYVMLFGPDLTSPLPPKEVPRYQPVFWGVPNLVHRLLYAIDDAVFQRIKASSHWSGSDNDLLALVRPSMLSMPVAVPLRDAIDWVYSSIFVTIKALKFSAEAPICGGPIEVAVISADRKFRWVSHKGLDQALSDHSPRGTY
jgi:hypothetical protein